MGKSLSPTQRTLRELRDQGRICGIVERFNRFAGTHGIRQDLFGFIDIIALDTERGIVGIQSCGQSFSEHRRKIVEDCNEAVFEWLRCGGKVELNSQSISSRPTSPTKALIGAMSILRGFEAKNQTRAKNWSTRKGVRHESYSHPSPMSFLQSSQ